MKKRKDTRVDCLPRTRPTRTRSRRIRTSRRLRTRRAMLRQRVTSSEDEDTAVTAAPVELLRECRCGPTTGTARRTRPPQAELAALAAASAPRRPATSIARGASCPRRRRRAASRASSRACCSRAIGRCRSPSSSAWSASATARKVTAALEALRARRDRRQRHPAWSRSRAAGTSARTPRTSPGCRGWSRASRSGCRARCWRRCRSSPTGSRSRAPRSTRSAASTAGRC